MGRGSPGMARGAGPGDGRAATGRGRHRQPHDGPRRAWQHPRRRGRGTHDGTGRGHPRAGQVPPRGR
ncbi:hypothetical protein ACFFX0_12760 [Citricoccus parietis]|uniref:Uncharacterized protein n=1 Tax=Citricoccus parietis TaxID=592307 RepID=A0ABV5G0I5_9MICC